MTITELTFDGQKKSIDAFDKTTHRIMKRLLSILQIIGYISFV